jgi:hypothetical protein
VPELQPESLVRTRYEPDGSNLLPPSIYSPLASISLPEIGGEAFVDDWYTSN